MIVKQKTGISDSSSIQVHTPKESSLEELKNLLINEPPKVVESVSKDWREIDSQIGNVLTVLKANVAGADLPSSNIKIQPDEFEIELETLFRIASPNGSNLVP